MICNDIEKREIIEKYVLDKLSENEKEEFEEHYFLCENCFEEVLLIQQVLEGTKELLELRQIVYEPEEADKHAWSLNSMLATLKEYFSVKWLAGAFAFAAVLLLVVLSKNFLSQPDLEEQRKLFAANSTPSPFMESLLGLSQRGANLIVVSPPNGFNVRNDLLFSWNRDDTSELTIIILNNREEELFTFSTMGNEYLFKNAADHLQPGLYYWKLEDENEVRHVGKFFVKRP